MSILFFVTGVAFIATGVSMFVLWAFVMTLGSRLDAIEKKLETKE